jgi:hypothetical protein
MAVHRLREGLGARRGKLLIETGCDDEYRLALTRDGLAADVLIEPAFFELNKLGVFSGTVVSQLKRTCRVLSSDARDR